eukprot:m.86130 g.86130  ORF g.86130 m.86130 type:complete len:89 (-) comp13043_c0_seq9:114-380(-)
MDQNWSLLVITTKSWLGTLPKVPNNVTPGGMVRLPWITNCPAGTKTSPPRAFDAASNASQKLAVLSVVPSPLAPNDNTENTGRYDEFC